MKIPLPTSPSSDSGALPTQSVRHNLASRQWAMGAQGPPRSNVEQGGGSSSETGKPLSRREIQVLTVESKKRKADLAATKYAEISTEVKKQKSQTDYTNKKIRESKLSIKQLEARREKDRALAIAKYTKQKTELKIPEKLKNSAHKAAIESKLAKQTAYANKKDARRSPEAKREKFVTDVVDQKTRESKFSIEQVEAKKRKR